MKNIGPHCEVEHMTDSDKRKQSFYYPEDMLEEIIFEANRLDRSLSWIVQKAWRVARGELMRYQSDNGLVNSVDDIGSSLETTNR